MIGHRRPARRPPCALDLPGPSRRIRVEPIRLPAPARPPEAEPAEAPERAPERAAPEREPAPA